MNLIDRILVAGLTDDMPKYLRRKVFPTNLIGLLLLCGLAIPFTVISVFYFDFLVLFPAIGVIVCIAVLCWNFVGGIYYTRFVLSIIPILLGGTYNAYLCNEGEQPLPALYLIELSFTMIPFVVFDLSERLPIIFFSVVCGLIIITFPITNDWFVSDIDSTVLRTGWLSTLTIGLAIACAIGCILGLVLLSKKAEDESETALVEMQEKKELLERSELELNENIKKLKEAKLIESKRNHTNEGISKVSEILRGLDMQAVYNGVITQIVGHTKAAQALFYRIDYSIKNKVTIKIAATYAYDSLDSDELIPEEAGLLGQAYLEGRMIYLTDLPPQFITVSSGLGNHNPCSVIIMPLICNDIIEGILEIAFFHKLDEDEIDFLSKTAGVLAAHIQTARLNEETNKLLSQTQNQAEEMRVQEEVLRQNMEDIEAIHKESVRKIMEYKKEIEELKAALQKV